MRLKKLILGGFKSFADRTEFSFDAPITGIVGPNGCGKSNVVDAFKWVLGEQSAKSLRGDAMLDVIFNGSSVRKPAGMAEVTLVFDNPLRDDGTRTLNLDLEEVSVARRLFRDGSSDYVINNQTSRLKDVRELFLDTGVGVDAYSVIEQGRVAALLESNPQERRLIFEEAAGISKFKARKKEAQRKLERVDQNLLRVNDIVEEVEKRLRSVKVQAGRARTYQEYSQRLSELRLTHALQEYHTHSSEKTQLSAAHDEAQFALEDGAADLQRQDEILSQSREEFDRLSQQRQQAEYQLVQARAALESAQKRQQYASQQLAQMAEQLERFAADREQVERDLAATTEALTAEHEAVERLTQELEQRRQEIDQCQQACRQDQQNLSNANTEIEQQKSAILDLMRKLSQVNSRLGAIEIEQKNLLAQESRLTERRAAVAAESESLAVIHAELSASVEQATAHLADQQTLHDQKKAELAQLGQQIAQVSQQLGAAREHRSGLLSRKKLLEDLEARREGVSEGVKAVLRQRDLKFSFIRCLVADVLRVDVEHAQVIEAALDGRDQLLLTSDLEAATRAREAIEELEGRVNILAIPPFVPLPVYDWNRHRPRVRLAIDLVKVDPSDAPIARHLLSQTVIVDSLEQAMELHRDGPVGFRYVTLAGQVIEADGTLRAGPLTAAMGILSRRSELEALGQQLVEVEQRIEQLGQVLADGNASARGLEEQISSLRSDIARANATRIELAGKLSQNRDRAAALGREAPLLERELQAVANSAQKLAAEQTAQAEQRSVYEFDQTARQARVEELTVEQKRLADAVRETSERLTAARVVLGQTQEQQTSARKNLERQTAAQQQLRQQLQRLTESAEGVRSRVGQVEADLAAAQTQETAQATACEQLDKTLASLGAEVSERSSALQTVARDVDQRRAEHAQREQAFHALQLRLSQVSVRLETLVQRTADESQIDLPQRYASLTTDGRVYEPGDVDFDAIGAEIKELREKVQRLGNVNLDAIGELDELEARQTFLATQVTDLTTSKKQLQELIQTINVESSARFEQTFNAVREHFQGMFRKLFGGGKADIYLETELEPSGPQVGPDGEPIPPKKIDPLDAGIEIIARPPGKQPVSISQLSGGEKTMTCVALLMSIFKSKPSPFCILDEVDAALDEANNQRFNLIVGEFLEHSQFIIITHSKRTMQIADVLYGVTMQEQGVSKRVAVKFDQVDSEGRISEQAAA